MSTTHKDFKHLRVALKPGRQTLRRHKAFTETVDLHAGTESASARQDPSSHQMRSRVLRRTKIKSSATNDLPSGKVYYLELQGLGEVKEPLFDPDLALKALKDFLPLFWENYAKGRHEALARAALVYKPQVTIGPVDLEQLEMQKKASERILTGTEWMTAAEVAREANRSHSNPNALANRWKKEGRVFAIKFEGVERYPRYAFDAQMAPLPVIGQVIPLFGEKPDPWVIAAWFESSNARLKSKRPREMLAHPDKVIEAARHRQGWMHG